MNNFSGLWAIGIVSSCLAPGPGMIKAEKYCLLGCTGQMGRYGSDLISLHFKGILMVEFFAVFKN